MNKEEYINFPRISKKTDQNFNVIKSQIFPVNSKNPFYSKNLLDKTLTTKGKTNIQHSNIRSHKALGLISPIIFIPSHSINESLLIEKKREQEANKRINSKISRKLNMAIPSSKWINPNINFDDSGFIPNFSLNQKSQNKQASKFFFDTKIRTKIKNGDHINYNSQQDITELSAEFPERDSKNEQTKNLLKATKLIKQKIRKSPDIIRSRENEKKIRQSKIFSKNLIVSTSYAKTKMNKAQKKYKTPSTLRLTNKNSFIPLHLKINNNNNLKYINFSSKNSKYKRDILRKIQDSDKNVFFNLSPDNINILPKDEHNMVIGTKISYSPRSPLSNLVSPKFTRQLTRVRTLENSNFEDLSNSLSIKLNAFLLHNRIKNNTKDTSSSDKISNCINKNTNESEFKKKELTKESKNNNFQNEIIELPSYLESCSSQSLTLLKKSTTKFINEIDNEIMKSKEKIQYDKKFEEEHFCPDSKSPPKYHCLQSEMGKIIKWLPGEVIGTGKFGQVLRCLNCSTGKIFAAKRILLGSKGSKDSLKQLKELDEEINILRNLSHPNIVKYLGSETLNSEYYIYMEYLSGGSIKSLIDKYGALDESTIKLYTRQILDGMIYLHSKNIIHMDIKAANILVSSEGKAKLSDFGCSSKLDFGQSKNDLIKTIKGSLPWMAPEVICQTCYSLKSDIWSLGCTLVEMATGNTPWGDFDNIMAAIYFIANSSKIPEIPSHLSEDAKYFISQCLNRDYHKRPKAEELANFRFVNS